MRTFSIRCIPVLAVLLTAQHARSNDWPQWLGPQRDGIWRETGIIDKFPADGPKIRWRAPIGGGYASPAVAGNRVVVTDRVLAAGVQNPKNAFDTAPLAGKERVLCLDDATGKELWKHEYDCEYELSYPAGPRCTPVIEGNRVYVLGAMGDLFCFELESGKIVWSLNFPRVSGIKLMQWGYSSHPLIDGDRLICLVGGKAGVVAAFDKNTGKLLWSALGNKPIGYGPPMIFKVGNQRQLIVWHPTGVNGLDPETGKELWGQPWMLHRSAMSNATPVLDNGNLFLTSFYNGAMLLKVPTTAGEKPTILWKEKSWENPRPGSEQPDKTEILHSIMPTPVVKDGTIYGICSYGELRGIEAATGKRLWQTFEATTGKETRWGNAFLTPQDDRFFIFNELGDLIIAKLSPAGYQEVSRAHILEPTNNMAGRPVVWSHPAYANKSAYVRNDKELVCVSLAK